MPANKMYLIRKLSKGHMFTVVSTSTLAALHKFMGQFGADEGEELAIKERGSSAWEAVYRVGRGASVRKLPT